MLEVDSLIVSLRCCWKILLLIADVDEQEYHSSTDSDYDPELEAGHYTDSEEDSESEVSTKTKNTCIQNTPTIFSVIIFCVDGLLDKC